MWIIMKFLTNEPALLLPGRTLVIADLHIGIEYEFRRSGIRMPSQTQGMLKRIDALLKTSKAKKLIILGDVKHKVPGLSWQEEREIPQFINRLNKKVPVEIVPGNHDPGLKDLLPNITMHHNSGLRTGSIYFLHGHAWPENAFLKSKTLIMGHTHPFIEFRDKLGYRWREPVWVRTLISKARIKKKFPNAKSLPQVVIMPAFNNFAGGHAINRKDVKLYGSVAKALDKTKAKIYLLDGTFLGQLSKL